MAKHFFTAEEEAYIKENYLKEPAVSISARFGLGKGIVSRYLKKHNLIVPAETVLKFRTMNKPVISSIGHHDDFLRNNYLTMPIKTMARAIGLKHDIAVRTRLRQLGLIVPKELAEERRKAALYPKGHVPFNKGKKVEEYLSPDQIAHQLKTSFQKGHVPANKTEIGTIRIRAYGGASTKNNPNYNIHWIKVGRGNLEWMPLHIYNWLESGRELPKKHCLAFKDGNQLNPEIDNLELISMAENMRRNSIQNFPEDLKEVLQLKGQLQRQINKHLKKKNHDRYPK